MKAILVISVPESCVECCCAYYTEGISHDYCQAVGYETDIKGYGYEPSLFDKEYKGKRPKWCPLKPMPTTEQIKALLKKGYGFMTFEELLDELSGEEE